MKLTKDEIISNMSQADQAHLKFYLLRLSAELGTDLDVVGAVEAGLCKYVRAVDVTDGLSSATARAVFNFVMNR